MKISIEKKSAAAHSVGMSSGGQPYLGMEQSISSMGETGHIKL